jgi:hypothetical protein
MLAVANITLAQEYSNKNEKPLSEVFVSSGKKAIWECKTCSYEWSAVIASRNSGRGCPNCAGKVANDTNSLSVLYPNIAQWFHPTLNTITANSLTTVSHKKVWWFCEAGHDYQQIVMNKVRQNDGCPFCSGRYASPENNLAIENPQLATEFDLIKNHPLTPYDITPRSRNKYYWICPKNHSYQGRLGDRNGPQKTGCPECRSIAHKAPHLLKEFDYEKNGKLNPKTINAGSSWTKVWWKCSLGHSWVAAVSSRTKPNNPTGCPDCVLSQTSAIETQLRQELSEDNFIKNIFDGQNSVLPIKWRTNSNLRVDILGEYNNQLVIIEYDGWYWHSDQISKGNASFIRDMAKTEALLTAGHKVIRIREERYDVCLTMLPITHENLLQIPYNYLYNKTFSDTLREEIYNWLKV